MTSSTKMGDLNVDLEREAVSARRSPVPGVRSDELPEAGQGRPRDTRLHVLVALSVKLTAIYKG